MSELRLLLVTDAVGGVWTYSLELAHALRPLGIETVLAVTGPSPSPEQREAAAEFRLVDTGLPLEWLDTDAMQIADAGKALALIAACQGADIVQTSSAALLAGGRFEQPCVAVQHSCVATWWQAVRRTPLPGEFEWRRELVAAGLAKADALVTPTVAFADATERAYDLRCRVYAVHNGRTAPRVRVLPQGDFILTAGRLWDEGKNARTLDRAAARIDAPFQVAGPTHGPNDAGIAVQKLHILGELSEARLRGLLAARPIFASAALYEPFGLSALEAAQAGCALVLSDIPTHRELWDGAAVLVHPRDDGAFANAINELLRDRDRRERLGKSSREHARRYTPQRMAHGMAEIYSDLVTPQLIAGAA
jgi:glycosyltransferase involved in cell wall biosynthesis